VRRPPHLGVQQLVRPQLDELAEAQRPALVRVILLQKLLENKVRGGVGVGEKWVGEIGGGLVFCFGDPLTPYLFCRRADDPVESAPQGGSLTYSTTRE
jgi:hypothetical protein